MSAKRYKCPKCGQLSGVRIVYGYPSDELLKVAESGDVVLGGCVIWGDDPNFVCKMCKHEWRWRESTSENYR